MAVCGHPFRLQRQSVHSTEYDWGVSLNCDNTRLGHWGSVPRGGFGGWLACRGSDRREKEREAEPSRRLREAVRSVACCEIRGDAISEASAEKQSSR
eukprot:1310457-Amphidinium_carterae.1